MRLKFFLLLIMFVVSSAVCTSCASAAVDPSTWPKPWSQNIKLKINWNHPFNKSAYHDTWGSPDESYTIDFMPPDNLQGSNDDIEIYSPVDGTVICSNLYSDVRDETLGGISSRKSCENGHYSIDEYGAYGQHIIIEPDGDEVASANDKEPKFSKNTFIIGHLRMDSKPSFVKENGKYKVKKGQFIGFMFDTGEGPKHMHFELVNHYRSSVNEQDCNAVKLFGFSESDF
ncbi:MAG: hypothetical protein IJ576_05775, partial [Synergistaceae bacterium]|nr:hypothetical protein [Synergistaceae bacterium]